MQHDCLQAEEAVGIIRHLQERPGLPDETHGWLAQSVYRSVEHLCITDFSDSGFISDLGLHAVQPLVSITTMECGKIYIEYLVYCNDGSCVSRHEALDKVPYIPTPEDIQRGMDEIRAEKPHSHYGEEWVGFEGPAVQEYTMDMFITHEEEEC